MGGAFFRRPGGAARKTLVAVLAVGTIVVMKTAGAAPTPEVMLRSWLARLDPATRKLAGSVRAALRRRLPTANELAYDYRTFVVVAYAANDRGIDAVVSFAARPDGVRLYFNQGPHLPDPKELLQGSGKQARFVRVESARQVAHPDMKALLAAALAQATVPLPVKGEGTLMLKTSAAKARSRRTTAR